MHADSMSRAICIKSSRENCKLVLLRIQHFCQSLTHLQASLGGYFWQKHVVWGKAGLLCLPDNATNKKEDLFHLANKDPLGAFPFLCKSKEWLCVTENVTRAMTDK